MNKPNYLQIEETLAFIVAMLKDNRVTLSLLMIMVLAYFSEASHPTYAMDYYYDYDAQIGPYYPFYSDGRFLAIWLRTVTGNIFMPTLYLIIGLLLFFISGMMICCAFKITDWKISVLTSALLATFPFVLEIQSFHPLRVTVPLAVCLTVFGVIHGDDGIHRSKPASLIGFISLFLALNLYQSILYLGVLLTIYLAILRVLQGELMTRTIKYYLLPKMGMYLLVIGVYVYFVKILQPYMIWPAVRLNRDGVTISTLAQLLDNYHLILGGLKEIFFNGVFLFPLPAKILFLLAAITLSAVISINLVKQQRFIDLLFCSLLFVIAPFMAFGVIWILKVSPSLMFDRVLYPIVMVYLAVPLLAWAIASNFWKKCIMYVYLCILAIFIIQANVWHEYLYMKNQSDDDLASKISFEICKQEDYKSGMPILITGKSALPLNLPYRLKLSQRKHIHNLAFDSTFNNPLVNMRNLQLYLPYNGPTDEQRMIATDYASNMPAWPSPGAVKIWQGIAIVKMSE